MCAPEVRPPRFATQVCRPPLRRAGIRTLHEEWRWKLGHPARRGGRSWAARFMRLRRHSALLSDGVGHEPRASPLRAAASSVHQLFGHQPPSASELVCQHGHMATAEDRDAHPERGSLSEVVKLFLKLGTIAFGGPAAHIALMHTEVVERRRWVREQPFLDLVGATNLIPGPSSTELAIYLGWRRAGWRGLVAAGACFIAPAFAIVLGLAVLYERYGTTPVATDLLYGVTPVVLAIIAHALVLLG